MKLWTDMDAQFYMLVRRRRFTFLAVAVICFLSFTPRMLYLENSIIQYTLAAAAADDDDAVPLGNHTGGASGSPYFSEGKGDSYRKRLMQVSDANGVIILALVDNGYVDVAINFWEVSILPFGINNMLFVSLSKKACDSLAQQDIPCHVYEDFKGGEEDSSYMSPIFLKKMNTRTQFILDALHFNLTILNTDTDVIFFKNPLSYFKCSNCHLEILEDGIKKLLNAGFIYLRPSPVTAEVYQRMAAIARKRPRSEDQANLNQVVKSDMKGKIKFNYLDQNKFVCGKNYYEQPRRYFADTAKSCEDCVVVHNNWIVGKSAKIYRQKEMLQWMYDSDGYYSDPDRKYLTYEQEVVKDTIEVAHREMEALIAAFAIGHILNRTVILPRLHCSHGPCPWNSKFYISHIDDSFKGKYRESVFLKHPKVPKGVKESLSPKYTIKTALHPAESLAPEVIIKTPNDIGKGATSAEIFNWFVANKESVLQLGNLFRSFKGFFKEEDTRKFAELLKDAFKKAVYRQY